MNTKRLFGLAAIGFTLALGCAGAQAMQADDPTIVRLMGANELAQGGASAVEFIEGRAMTAHRYSHTVPVSATSNGDGDGDGGSGGIVLQAGFAICLPARRHRGARACGFRPDQQGLRPKSRRDSPHVPKPGAIICSR